MNKNIKKFIVSLGIVGLFVGTMVFAVSAGDVSIAQRDPTNMGNLIRFLPLPASGADGVIGLNGSSSLPQYMLMGTGMNFDGTNLNVLNLPESSVTNLSSDLTGKLNVPTGTTSQVVLGNGTLGTLPVVPSSVSTTYQTLVSQTGTSAPTGASLVNDFTGTTFAWARTSTGTYTLTASNPVFTSGKTAVLMSNPNAFLNNFKYTTTSSTVITFQTATLSVLSLILTPGNADGLLSNSMMYVVVYP